jgi:hypothetical protein
MAGFHQGVDIFGINYPVPTALFGRKFALVYHLTDAPVYHAQALRHLLRG